ncbi:MAG TPA: hypothetical protein VGV64_02770 [Thermoplasmata archaeon]|nr:hypothetical protein [Thermoplasmata archaeon]HEV2428753.1 hypothetical protein [Thermoplasmata archaeon]
MTRANESGGYQGAISSMLAVADVCASCGVLLAEHTRPAGIGSTPRCPESDVGAFPFIQGGTRGETSHDEPFSPTSAPSAPPHAPSSDETATGVFAGTSPVPRAGRRSDLLAMTWSLAHGAEEFP